MFRITHYDVAGAVQPKNMQSITLHGHTWLHKYLNKKLILKYEFLQWCT